MATGAFFNVLESGPRFRNDKRTAAAAERAAGTEQGVLFTQMPQGMERYLRYVETARQRHPVQGFDIRKLFAEFNARDMDLAVNERVKDEGIVRARRIADGEHLLHVSQPSTIC